MYLYKLISNHIFEKQDNFVVNILLLLQKFNIMYLYVYIEAYKLFTKHYKFLKYLIIFESQLKKLADCYATYTRL